MDITEKALVELIGVWAKKVGVEGQLRRIYRDNRRGHAMWVMPVGSRPSTWTAVRSPALGGWTPTGDDTWVVYDLGYTTRGWNDSEMWVVMGSIFHEFGHILEGVFYTGLEFEEDLAREEEKAERKALELFDMFLPELKQPYIDWIKGTMVNLLSFYEKQESHYIMAYERVYGKLETIKDELSLEKLRDTFKGDNNEQS